MRVNTCCLETRRENATRRKRQANNYQTYHYHPFATRTVLKSIQHRYFFPNLHLITVSSFHSSPHNASGPQSAERTWETMQEKRSFVEAGSVHPTTTFLSNISYEQAHTHNKLQVGWSVPFDEQAPNFTTARTRAQARTFSICWCKLEATKQVHRSRRVFSI